MALRFVIATLSIGVLAFLGMLLRPQLKFEEEQPPMFVFQALSSVLNTLRGAQQVLSPPPIRLLEIAGGPMKFQALYAATKLGIPDALASGPLHYEEIAKRVNASIPENLNRIMKANIDLGFFTLVKPDVYANNRDTEYLRSDTPLTMRYMMIHFGNHLYKPWGNLIESVNQKEPVATSYYGKNFWDHLLLNKDESEVFDKSMKAVNTIPNILLAEDYNWSQFNTVADIGGGIGSLLESILKKHPSVNGIVFDRESQIKGAREVWSQSPNANRVQLVDGDFFESVPESDAYVLRFILHDWNDEDSIRILKTIRKAIGSKNATLLVIDYLIGETKFNWVSPEIMDLHMMVMFDARERTKLQMENVFRQAGFEMVDAVKSRSPFFICVGKPIPITESDHESAGIEN